MSDTTKLMAAPVAILVLGVVAMASRYGWAGVAASMTALALATAVYTVVSVFTSEPCDGE